MGGGGDDGYEARQQDIERKKQIARAQLNAQFGYGSADPASMAASVGPAPDRATYTRAGTPTVNSSFGEWGGAMETPGMPVVDESGYQGAMADYNNRVNAKQAQTNTNGQARDSLYQSVRDNAYNAGKRQLDERQQEAARKLKFELFATGQAGGSGDIDENAKQKRTYSQGLIDLGAKADSAKADFRNSDEDTRLQLLQSIDNGMDQGSALSSASQRMQIAADKAAADANGTTVGDLFDTSGAFYNQSQFAKGRQAGQQRAWEMFPQSNGFARGATATGVTTRLPGE